MKQTQILLLLCFTLMPPAWSQGYSQPSNTPSSSGGGFFHGLRRLGGAMLYGTATGLNSLSQTMPVGAQPTQYTVPQSVPSDMSCNQFAPNPGYQTSMSSYPQMQTYSGNTIGTNTYLHGAGGMTTVNRIGNMTYINSPNGTTTGNTIGNMTFYNGPGGSTTANRIGDFTYFNGPNGQNWNSQDIGNFTYVHGPNGKTGTIQRIGDQTYSNFPGGF